MVLDGLPLNPGDISWSELEKLGELTVYEDTASDQLVSRIKDANIVFTNKVPITGSQMEELPHLRFIGVLATGYDIVDLESANRFGITITNVPSYSTDSVAQLTFSLLLELCMHVKSHSEAVKNGKWSTSKHFCFWDHPLIELSGKTMGIIGMGAIGEKVCHLALAFGMRVKCCSSQTSKRKWNKAVSTDLNILLKESDVVSIHCPLNESTRELINLRTLRLMKHSAFLINTSRGAIIKEEDLVIALENGWIAGAGLDVLSIEPPVSNNRLLFSERCIITPHMGWATIEARQRLLDSSVNNLKKYLAGEKINIVN